DRFESSRYFYILSDEAVVNTERKTIVGGVTTGLRNNPAARSGRILQYLPTNGFTLAGQSLCEAGRPGSYRHERKVDCHRAPPYGFEKQRSAAIVEVFV